MNQELLDWLIRALELMLEARQELEGRRPDLVKEMEALIAEISKKIDTEIKRRLA